ncbi:hypothetical protein EDD85DRAFT_959174 [Armillaria nabsnona]|nr:hypothetical protein EDD85DRAFT_959174 [Armillaria nabsnona]
MLEKWTAATYQGFPAFNLSNQYFCNAKDGTQHEAIEFSKDVDPVGILQRLGKSNVMHMEDNKVQYFKSHVDEEGRRRYQHARPQLFRVGDIVEVQCSVIFVKAKGMKHQMKLVLCLIALLDCEITLDAKRKMINMLMQEEPSAKCLKRQVGYEDDEEEKEKKCVHMDESSG